MYFIYGKITMKSVFQNKVVHTPEVLAQFVQIGLLAPSSVNDVPAAICQLADRLVSTQICSNLPVYVLFTVIL